MFGRHLLLFRSTDCPHCRVPDVRVCHQSCSCLLHVQCSRVSCVAACLRSRCPRSTALSCVHLNARALLTSPTEPNIVPDIHSESSCQIRAPSLVAVSQYEQKVAGCDLVITWPWPRHDYLGTCQSLPAASHQYRNGPDTSSWPSSA